jgi:3-O-methylgallate 3,4-dioxygenase
MARIVLAVATSHTPMLNAPAEDWPCFIDRDRVRDFLDKDGRPATYDELLARAEPAIAAELTPERLAARHGQAQQGVEHLRAAIGRAELDALIVVGDDHKELYQDDNLPAFVVYHGKTIRNVPLAGFEGPDWARRATARYYEAREAREYPVESGLARHLIGELVEREFDPVASDALPAGKGEGHAFAFVRKRLMVEETLPTVPVLINTYFPPNQPIPRRCWKFGEAICAAVESYPANARIGIVGSGGLSHFVVDEALDRAVIDAIRKKDGAALQALPREKLNSGSSEIRLWICAAGAAQHLDCAWTHYVPGYRTPAGSGTGLGFALWT